MAKAASEFKYVDEEELYIHVGSGKYSAKDVIEKIPTLKKEEEDQDETSFFYFSLQS